MDYQVTRFHNTVQRYSQAVQHAQELAQKMLAKQKQQQASSLKNIKVTPIHDESQQPYGNTSRQELQLQQ